MWIVVLSDQHEEYHHLPTFYKKIQEWKQNHVEHKLVIVSKNALDRNSSKMASIEVTTDVINEMKLVSNL